MTVKPFLRIETGPETELESDIKEEQPVEQPNDQRRSEINGLLEKGVFEPVTIEDVL